MDISKFTFQYGSIQIQTIMQSPVLVIHIYIPIWFYSNQAKNQRNPRKIDLHSNMVLFKWRKKGSKLSSIADLHSNMVLFKLGETFKYAASTAFTFQYGSIQIDYAKSADVNKSLFTFQYGSIQITYTKSNHIQYMNLHSNMVLFKWCSMY